ncbi:hypothetical protein LTR78_007177 [Recurvomyces mirabilis]|uniref:WSC domain-containing protein n=1 Tax=Recurvomyces mirabilis TaxID=574656 RepID=A0AAE1BYY0_9PEZI|nr:hypothetical protein LTR78_007177 [Recurvomyces mirabilis]KAK5150851.1 hypothetical protein LTS14_009654 [Recurvomyces mirabilis]
MLAHFVLSLLGSSLLAQGAVLNHKQQPRDTTDAAAQWAPQGCWSDNRHNRTLAALGDAGTNVTNVKCQSRCAGYRYAGTEYSGECYCGDYLNSITSPLSDLACYMTCTGDDTETCGGPNALSLYWDGQAAPASTPISVNAGVDGWTSQGCYTDQVGSRTLSNGVATPRGASSLTVQLCVDTCGSAGYTLAGVEYSGECYCGNSTSTGAVAEDQSACNMPCYGNGSEYCGGANAINLYSFAIAPPANTSTSASSATATPTATQSTSATPTMVTSGLPDGYTYQGCWADLTNGRILSVQQPDSATLTPASCVSTCYTAGYSYAGVEWSKQCFCGKAIVNGGYQAVSSYALQNCHVACTGDTTQGCGGSRLMALYYSNATTSS